MLTRHGAHSSGHLCMGSPSWRVPRGSCFAKCVRRRRCGFSRKLSPQLQRTFLIISYEHFWHLSEPLTGEKCKDCFRNASLEPCILEKMAGSLVLTTCACMEESKDKMPCLEQAEEDSQVARTMALAPKLEKRGRGRCVGQAVHSH